MKHRKGSAYAPFEVLQRVVFASKVRGRRAMERGQKVDFDGDWINMSSGRLQTFASHGVVCVWCKIEGKLFYKEKYPLDESYHMSLYALDSQGGEVPMTRVRSGDDWVPVCRPCSELPADAAPFVVLTEEEGASSFRLVERDLLPFVVLTEEGSHYWVKFLEKAVVGVFDEGQYNLEGEVADLLDSGDLVLQAQIQDAVFQLQLPRRFWRWNGHLGSEEAVQS